MGVGVATFLRPGPDVAARLTAAAEAGARARPDLLADFRPLTKGELAAGGGTALRGGVSLLEPGERVLVPPTRLAWKPVAGASLYRVTLLDAAGLPLWTREASGPALDWPANEAPPAPGTKGVVEVAAETPLGQVEGRRAFAVASPGEARSFEEAAQLLATEEPALGDLLRAHLALRRGFLAEALNAARLQATRTPVDPLARATLMHAERLAGERSPD